MEPDDAPAAASSSLSSYTSSQDRARSSSPARKRLRLSSASPPPPTLPLPVSPAKELEHPQASISAIDDLLDGLGDDDFRLLPSSDPAGATSSDHHGDDGGQGVRPRDDSATTTADEAELSAGEGAADDSGLGLLPDVEVDKGGSGEAEALEAAEDVEFEGDDMWLEFDNAALGFDQPDTFPSSALAPAKADKGTAADAVVAAEEARAHERFEEPRLSDFGFANFDSAAPMTAGGFVFATRKPFVISDKALQRARALLDAEDSESSSSSTVSPALQSPAAGPRAVVIHPSVVKPVPPASRPSSRASNAAEAPPPAFVGFQNAAGRKLDMPSEEALQRAKDRLDVPDSPPESANERTRNPLRPTTRPALPSRDVFQGSPAPKRAQPASLAGSTFALPPPLPRPVALDLVALAGLSGANGPFDSPTTARTRPTSAASSTGRSGGAGTSGRHTPLLEVGASAQAAHDGELVEKASSTTVHSSSPPALAQAPPPPTAGPALVSVASAAPSSPTIVAPVPIRPFPAIASRTATPSTRPGAFRPPILASASTPARTSNSATPLRSSVLASHSPFPTSTANPLLPQQRRLNLGMTPRNKPFHLANTRSGTPGARGAKTGVKAFVTPFKGGKRPEGLTPMGLKDMVNPSPATASRLGASPRKVQAHAKKVTAVQGAVSRADEARRDKVKVFDLEATVGERDKLGEFGMLPQTHFYEHLVEIGIPKEIFDTDSTSGVAYVFPCGHGMSEAFTALQALVTERVPEEKDLVALPWVKNHWSLILWKFASYVRSRPDLLGDWWTFERVMDQLRYRYEREVNRAERSAIKRIQERDSPASLPMVLCVSQIRWDDPPEEADNGSLVIVGLELTDGWYRIRTNVDKTLKSACERGKIVVGSKLALMGAKLDSVKSEGSEVLKALTSSTLVISGNSTSLAPWHATLGFHPEPFVASLSSLSSSGGLVPLVDVVIDRAFPCGYIDLRKGRGTETWGEEEELTRAEEWKRGRKRIEIKLSEEAEKAGTEEDEVVELLQEAASMFDTVGNCTAPASTPPEEPDEILERIEEAANKRAVIRKLSPPLVLAALALAVENARASRFRAVEDLQKELAEKYPPRDVRGFRVLRVSDAREGTKLVKRTALVTVWDAQSFAADFFHEGTRYLISNTMPKGNWRPQDREVSLATRRDSRWRKV